MSDLWKRVLLGAAVVAAVAAVGYLLPSPLKAAASGVPGRGIMMAGGMMGGAGGMNGSMGAMGNMMSGDMTQMHTAMTGMYQKALDAIASTLGMKTADLSKALEDGRKLADIATEKGIDATQINAAVLVAHQTFLDDLVIAGTLTKDQADQMLDRMSGVDFVIMFDGSAGASGNCHGNAADSGEKV